MKHTRTLVTLLTGAALALTMLPTTVSHARTIQRAAPQAGSYYLALGDSLSVGYQPDPSTSWTHGWVYQFRDMLAKTHPVELQNLAIRGECSDTLLTGSLNADCPTKVVDSPSQLAEAVTFLKDHPGQVNPITVEIGGNNLNGHKALFLSSTPAQQQAILAPLFPKMAHDWGTIFATLRAACPKCEILALNQYNPFPAGSVKADMPKLFGTYTGLLGQVAMAAHVKVVNVYTPFVGKELAYTWIARGDIHATTSGYTAMAQAVATASGFPMPAAQ